MKMTLIILLFMAVLAGTKLGLVRDVMGQEPFIMYERDIPWQHEIFWTISQLPLLNTPTRSATLLYTVENLTAERRFDHTC